MSKRFSNKLASCFWILATCFYSSTLLGQEWNIGVHANPVLTLPLLNSRATYTGDLKPSPMHIGGNAGVNLQFKYQKLSLEGSPSYIHKAISFGRRDGLRARSYNRFTSSSLELPVLLGWNIHHHQKTTTYDLYAIAGAAYEFNEYVGTISGSRSGAFAANSAEITVATTSETKKLKQWTNAIFGFKINAIVRKFGLIDYGLTYHLPFGYTGPYNVELVNSGNAITNQFRPKLSHLDIKLCYYFLNLDNRLNRIRYKDDY